MHASGTHPSTPRCGRLERTNFGTLDWLGDDDVEHSEAPAEAAAAVLVARGPARAGRRNAQFKAEVCAAFNTIGLDAGSCLPPTHVPARDPDVLSASHHQDEHARRPPGLSRA
jgi:hypothetical protein